MANNKTDSRHSTSGHPTGRRTCCTGPPTTSQGFPTHSRANHSSAGLPKMPQGPHTIKGPPTTQQGHPGLNRATLSITAAAVHTPVQELSQITDTSMYCTLYQFHFVSTYSCLFTINKYCILIDLP